MAHPHVAVDMKTKVIFDSQGRATGLGLFWAFDEGYSDMAIDGLDKNNDGDYSSEELLPLTKANLSAIADYHYFTEVTFNGEAVATEVPDLGHTLQLVTEGRLAFYFMLPFKAPVDPRNGRFAVRVFDPDYFIAFSYADADPFLADGKPATGCKMRLLDSPDTGDVAKTRQFLSSKDAAWKPSPLEQFGGMFAQTLVVDCAKK
jgi:ABC-type uncharacterized transport system substrate-binding protein